MSEIFDSLEYFDEYEQWGEPEKVCHLLLYTLNELRKELGHPFIIHCAYDTDGHSPKSRHYFGYAVDFHIRGLSLDEGAYKIVKKLRDMNIKHGLGLYPDWSPQGGYHLDLRSSNLYWIHKYDNYKYYHSLNEALENITFSNYKKPWRR